MDPIPPLDGPVLLDKNHDLTTFDCGVGPLNDYLQKHTLQNNQNRSARTYVATRGGQVVGFYTLAAGSVSKSDAPPRVAKGLGNYPVPIILIARLAVDNSERGKGLGKGLLKDALLRSLQAANLIGCRAVLVHAKDQTAINFYEKHGFEPSPIDESHLFLLLKDIVASLGIEVP
jgi:GNAT superfamily N-acetyltransferase